MRGINYLLLSLGLLLPSGCGWSNNPFALARHDLENDAKFVGEANPLTVDIPVAKPNAENPVTLGAAVDRTQVMPGSSILLVVRCKTAEPWYIYAADGKQDIGVPTRLELKLPRGVTQQSPWQLPVSKPKESPLGQVGTYANDVRFMVPLLVDPLAPPGKVEVQCTFHFQACSDSTCLSPASHKLVIPVTIQPK
jgi:DsbC/DsbD-like thiol-disulfide interchange protein